MRYAVSLCSLAAIAVGGCTALPAGRAGTGPMLAHNVYFALNDDSPTAREALVADCYKYLRNHQGVTCFFAGEIVEAHAREVNVRDWDVGLHIVFASRKDHDRYQEAPDHHRFIEANRGNWKSVRVFDTFVGPTDGD